MRLFLRNLSNRFPFFANRPSALERAVRTSPKSRRLRMEPLENRALLAVDAFGASAFLDVGESGGPDPAPAAFSASVLATDAEVIDVSGVNATLAETSFSVQTETPEPVAPPSFDQLMESLGMIEIESLGDESDAASLSYLDATDATQVSEAQAEARQVVFYDSSAADFDASTLNLDDESVYYVDAANAGDAESYSVTPRSGGSSSGSGGSGGSSSSGGSGGVTVDDPNDCSLTTSGSTEIFETATFTGSGGSDHGPYFGFTTSAIPSGYWAYVRFKGGSAVYGQDYVVRCATVGEGGVVTPNMSYVSGGSNPDGSYDIYVYGPASYSVVPLNDSVLESNETVVAGFYLVDMQSGGADYDPTPILCDSFTATICQAPEFLTGNDANIINTDVRNLGFIYDKPEVGDVVSIPGGLNLETNGRAVTYSLESTPSSEYFEINSATGEISWKALPENQTYDFNLTVKATDSACAQQYDTLQLSFTYGWASFVLCVEQPNPGTDDIFSVDITEITDKTPLDSLNPGHAFWIIEATTSLQNYCQNQYSAANSINGAYSYNDIRTSLNVPLGFYPASSMLALSRVPGCIKNDSNLMQDVDAYSVNVIPEANFLNVASFVTTLRNTPGIYHLGERNCVNVATAVAAQAGIQIDVTNRYVVGLGTILAPGQLGEDLQDSTKNDNGSRGNFTINSSLYY